MKVINIIKHPRLKPHRCNIFVSKMAWRLVTFLTTCDILEVGVWLFFRLLYWHGALHISTCVFYRNVDLHTRANEQFKTLMLVVHRCAYRDCHIALGQRSKAMWNPWLLHSVIAWPGWYFVWEHECECVESVLNTLMYILLERQGQL
jgi:hypothetical protein